MLVDPAETVVLLPSRTRYEQRGGGTETSTERRIIYSPEIPGPAHSRDQRRMGDSGAGGAGHEARACANTLFPWQDTQDIRNEIDRVCPTYKGIAKLRKKGDSVQYGGRHLLVDRCPTPDGKGHFTAVELPEENVPNGRFLLSTRRGKQFNSIINADVDPTHRRASRRRPHGRGRRADGWDFGTATPSRYAMNSASFADAYASTASSPGACKAHWPEANVLIPAGRLDASGIPDYNATVEVVGGACLTAPETTIEAIA